MHRIPRDAIGVSIPYVNLYDDPTATTLDLKEIAAYLRAVTRAIVKTKREFLSEYRTGGLEELARAFATARVRRLDEPHSPIEPLFGEVQFELRLLKASHVRVTGVLYDAIELQDICRSLLPRRLVNLNICHIVFTHRLFGTFGEDGRYHARVNLCGYPSLISTTGIVEAPAKPREYYSIKRGFEATGTPVPFELIKERFHGQFIDYDDPLLTEVMKGYALQCLAYQAAGEAFCENIDCRLYNAHWQSEVLRAQIESGSICRKHTKLFEAMRRRSAV